jgi:hypothetical protein
MIDESRQAVTPLRMVFWGGLLCVFDFNFSSTSNGAGFTFDFLNDAAGMILIVLGVTRLSNLPVHYRYARAMTFVRVVSWLALLNAIRLHFILRWPQLIQFGFEIFGLVTLVATVVFCIAMRWFCEYAGLERAASSWSLTTKLFAFIYLIPTGLMDAFSAFVTITGAPIRINLGPLALLLLPLYLVPVIHFFVSTSRMKRDIDQFFRFA